LANNKSILGVQHEKVMLIVFFDHKGVVHHKHIPHDLLMNQHFDTQLTQCFCTPRHSEQHLKQESSDTQIHQHNATYT